MELRDDLEQFVTVGDAVFEVGDGTSLGEDLVEVLEGVVDFGTGDVELVFGDLLDARTSAAAASSSRCRVAGSSVSPSRVTGSRTAIAARSVSGRRSSPLLCGPSRAVSMTKNPGQLVSRTVATAVSATRHRSGSASET